LKFLLFSQNIIYGTLTCLSSHQHILTHHRKQKYTLIYFERTKTGNETIPVQSPFETSEGLSWRIRSMFASTFIPEGSVVGISWQQPLR